ncbi:MAG: DUF2274 domain-containing protein [Pseudomonadota bacterium]
MPDLKLPKLPKIDTVRLNIVVPTDLYERLELYARIYSETYGEPVDLKRLMPHMLERFLTSDREFQRRMAKLSRQQRSGPPTDGRAIRDGNSG